MSDPASLALAIAPLVIGILKTFRTLKSKLRVFSHYSRELNRVRIRYQCQQDFFCSECELLLRNITVSQSQIEEFVSARQLDNHFYNTLAQLCRYLGPRQAAFESTLVEIQACLQHLAIELYSFQQFESMRQDGESLKDAVRRLRCRLKITFNKSTYDEELMKLKESNYDLQCMRKHSQKLKQPTKQPNDIVSGIKPLSLVCRRFGKVRVAALAFHEVMVTHWVCAEGKHQRHLIRLFTDADFQHDVRMNFVLLGERGLVGSTHSDLIPLEVRSAIVECPELSKGKGKLAQRLSSPIATDSGAVKRRRIAWADEVPTTASLYMHPSWNTKSPDLISQMHEGTSPKAGEDLMADTLGCILTSQQIEGPACLGYLDAESQPPFRHSFYPWSGICNKNISVINTYASAKPLDKLFEQPVDEHFDVLDQLLLAKTMVSTMLKFHSTPWLGSWWTLKDIYYLGNRGEMAEVLSTLHVGGVLDMKGKQVCNKPTELTLLQPAGEEGSLSRQIRNTVLYNLGVGLLQIDRWAILEPTAIAHIDKLAMQRSRLGPKYRGLVEKCLHCDFGVGADLLKPQLQTAILENVMQELEAMIASLSMDEDDEDREGE